MKLVERVLATNVYIDNKNQPHSIPLLLRYEPQIGSFLEGPTVPRSQEVQVEPTVLFVAPPVATAPDSESFDLIPSGQVSEMAPPINPFKLMGKTAKRSPYGAGKGKAKGIGAGKKGKKPIVEAVEPELPTPNSADQEPSRPLPGGLVFK
jgi:hypothetical protein